MSEGSLQALDWAVIAGYLVVALGAGVWIGRKSRGSMENFFLSGRSLPWWLAGTSMVATSFASDTPLVICGWTRAGGITGNWRWWAYIMGTLLVVVLFARLWQRSRVLTDVEFMELRYSGLPATWLRGFKGVYQVIFMHCFVMGWVILGMTKVLGVLFGFGSEPVFELLGWGVTPVWLAMVSCALLALVYSEVAGLWGVVLTDFIQFGLAMAGAVILMLEVAGEYGGMGGLVDALRAAPVSADKLATAPDTTGMDLGDPVTWTSDFVQFLIFVGVAWVASKNVDGSGVMVQRLLASKDEKHAMKATLWYAVAHNAVRPWPWILVALASLLVLPPASADSPVDGTVVSADAAAVVIRDTAGTEHRVALPDTGVEGWEAVPLVAPGAEVRAAQAVASTDDEAAYPEMMLRFLPAGLLGLLAASFLAAFMSTIDTHVNLASSYLVNDVYRRFLRDDAAPAHYVRMARLTGPLILVAAVLFAANADSVRSMFDTFTTLFSGVGVVYVLRWLWWRTNAWSEIAALLTGAGATWLLDENPGWAVAVLPPQLVQDGAPVFAGSLVLVLLASLAVVLPVTLLTPPVARERLQAFHDRVRPPGFWGPFRARERRGAAFTLRLLAAWTGSTALVLAAVLVPGDLLFADGAHLGAWLGVAAGGALLLAALPPLPSRDGPGGP